MTANATLCYSPDIFTDPAWPLFSANRELASGLEVAIDQLELLIPITTCRQSAVEQLSGHLQAALASPALSRYRMNAFIARRLTPPINRVARYKGLWKVEPLVQVAGVSPLGTDLGIEADDPTWFCGLVSVEGPAVTAVLERSRAQSPTVFVFLSPEPVRSTHESLRQLFDSAFPGNQANPPTAIVWSSLTRQLCTGNDLLLRMTGRFDDRETALAILGARPNIAELRAVLADFVREDAPPD